MKTKIGNEPVQKISLAGKLRLLATCTRIVQDQAVMMEAAQKLEKMQDALLAVKARINGEFDHPALMAVGPLLPDTLVDCLRIAEAALGRADK